MFVSKVGELFNSVTSGISNPAEWLVQYLGGGKSSSGIQINMESVLGIPEVWNAVSRISGHIAQMPIKCIQNQADGSEEVYLQDFGAKAIARPNEFFTKFTVMEKMMLDALIYGNGRLYIERNSLGQPTGLLPLQAEASTTVVHEGERWHTVSISTATAVGELKAGDQASTLYKIPDRDVLYLMGLSRNGWWGENLLHIMKDTFGLAIAGQEAAGAAFRNAGRPGLILEAPRGAFRTEKEASAFLHSFDEAHRGLDKTGRTGMIREGMKANVLPNEAAGNNNHVDQRKFGRESMAIIFLLEHLLGTSGTSQYKSLTEKNAAYLQNCLSRWVTKIEDEMNLKLLSGRQRESGIYHYELDSGVIFKQDKMAVAQYSMNLRQQGIISANEARKLHGLPPVDELKDNFTIGQPQESEEPEETEDTAVEKPNETKETEEENSNEV